MVDGSTYDHVLTARYTVNIIEYGGPGLAGYFEVG